MKLNTFRKSIFLAQSGRPGPVVIDIPMNFQKAIINPKKLKSFIKPKDRGITNNLNKQIENIKKLLMKSKRPVLLIGGGIKVAKSESKLDKIINKLSIPVVTTWSGVDLIDHNKLYVGNVGVYGSRAANFSVQNSDLLISLGSRLDTRITGGVPSTFARNAKVVAVDIDKNELSKKRGLKLHLKICSDLSIFLEKFYNQIKNLKSEKKKKWHLQCYNWKRKYPIVAKEYYNQKSFVNPYVFIYELSKLANRNSVIVADDGGHLTWTLQAFKVKKGQKLFSYLETLQWVMLFQQQLEPQ